MSGGGGRPAGKIREIAAILVSWNDADEIVGAVESLRAARDRIPPGGPNASLVVVVNGPTGVPAEAVEARWDGARVLVNEENRGFGVAANQGAALASSADAVLFVNPDARAEGDPFSEVARGFEEHPESVALAPRLLDLDEHSERARGRALSPPGKDDQFSFQLRRLPTLASDARELLLWDHLFPNGRARRRNRYADADRNAPFPVEQAAGAALAVRSGIFRRIGGFSPEFVPAWYEDVDLCARLAAEGTILFWPAARFRHRGGVSMGRLGYARFLPMLHVNGLRYRRRYYGAPARAAYRVLLAAGMILRLLLLPLRTSVPRSRREAATAYARVLGLALGFRRARITNHQSRIANGSA